MLIVGFPILVTAQDVDDMVRVEARVGAKVNVRSAPDVAIDNVVGKAAGGDLARVLEVATLGAYDWFRVSAANGGFEGWIRGDLIANAPEAAISETVTEADPVAVANPAQPPAETAEPGVSNLAQRRADSWTRDLDDYVEAVRSCVETGSAQPAIAFDLRGLQRGLIEVEILDAANRQWKCVIRGSGGTPLRFDPTHDGGSPSRRDGPFFASATTGRPAMQTCDEVEPVERAGDLGLAGWVIYTDCP